MLLNKISVRLALLMGLSACSEKETVLSQRETWLSTGGWQMTNYTYHTRAAAGGTPIQFEFITGRACEADDLYRFEATNKLQWDKNGTLCPTSQPPLTEWGTWQLLNSDTKLAIDHQGTVQFPYTGSVTGPLDIVELTSETMVLRTTDIQAGDSVVAYTYRFIKP
ncbi:lipocalin family protein [Microvirga sp. STR05]|uniref:Lipocalin family protein n=1 Tax=Hymenobacter duratus TaxID=2771356 RepID=A0ABR8JAV1_9BACT|nr:lipocalin family protein [Hymenobacter duratus]MBD2713745.1 lipocalin family protein [Hymenobacter duratus]MBR7948647.1 lipocalin family protein [Microvirga sp. STR05]